MKFLRISGVVAVTGLLAALIWAAMPSTVKRSGVTDVAICWDLRPTGAMNAKDLLQRLGPLPDATGPAGEVPRRAPRRLPDDWVEALDSSEARKQAFVRVLLPMVLSANEAILADRRRLRAIIQAGGVKTNAEGRWLLDLADHYGTAPSDVSALLRRVDAVPVSLAIAQAAIESGWGSSRFVREGNALFGQWTWNASTSMPPRDPRPGLGGYGIRRFHSLAESVRHYMHNLNSHRAYRGFQAERARLRAAGQPLRGLPLVPTVARYSEKRAEYVQLVRTIIVRNKLAELNQARLATSCASVASNGRDKLHGQAS